MLFQIPEALQIQLLEQWFDFWMIFATDTALCNHKLRSEWMSLWKSGLLRLSEENFGKIDDKQVQEWVFRRKICVDYLDLSFLGGNHESLTSLWVDYFPTMKSHIKKLDVQQFVSTDEKKIVDFYDFILSCPNLTELSDPHFNCLVALSVHPSLKRVHLKKFLPVGGSVFVPLGSKLCSLNFDADWSSEVVFQLAEHCQHLTEIKFQGTLREPVYSLESLQALLEANRHIEKVTVGKQNREGFFQTLATHISPTLTAIQLTEFTTKDSFLLLLMQRCTLLRELEIAYAEDFDYDVYEHVNPIIDVTGLVAACRARPELTRLSLSNLACDAIDQVLSACPSLTCFQLGNHTAGRAESVLPALAEHPNTPLRELNVDCSVKNHEAGLVMVCSTFRATLECVFVNTLEGWGGDAVLNSLAGGLTREFPDSTSKTFTIPLRELRLTYAKFHPASLAALLYVAPFLVKLSLHFCCQSVDDAVLEFIGTGAPNLQFLNVQHCSRITDTGVRSLLKQCMYLAHPLTRYATLAIDGCFLVSAELRKKLRERGIFKN